VFQRLNVEDDVEDEEYINIIFPFSQLTDKERKKK